MTEEAVFPLYIARNCDLENDDIRLTRLGGTI